MTVENDGLPPPEDGDPEPIADGTLDPSPETVPPDAATATKLAAADAAARQAQLNAPVDPAPPVPPLPVDAAMSEEPTQVLPRAGRPAPTRGTMEGDLFEDGS
jgi:hypothetical protein